MAANGQVECAMHCMVNRARLKSFLCWFLILLCYKDN